MRSHTRILALMGIVASGGVFACVGGGGTFDDAMSMRDPASSSFERAESTRELDPGTREGTTSSHEGVGISAEPGPGAQGTGGVGGFQCGTFSCVEDGDDDADELTFTSTGAGCSVSVGENTLVLSSDGTITINGQSVGTWQATGSGFTGTVQNERITCTRGGSGRGDGTGGGDGSGQGGGGGGGSGREDDAPAPGIPPADDSGG